MENTFSTIAGEIEKNGWVLSRPVGVSMKPMLRCYKDPIYVVKPSRPFKVNDVVVYYVGENNQIVMHRIIKVRKNDYVIRGDNCLNNEYGITDDDIFGILEGFYRGERYIDCEKSKPYKVYVFFNRITYYPRFLIKKAAHLLRALIKNSMKGENNG